MSESSRIFIADDEPRICESLQILLDQEGFKTSIAVNKKQALDLLRSCQFDLFLLDIWMPEMDGFELLDMVIENDRKIPAIMMTGAATLESAILALKKGAYDYIRKPFEYEELIKTIRNALDQKKLKEQNEAILRQLQISERRYRYMIQNSPDIIYTLDQNGNFTFVNETVTKLLGYDRNEIIGKPYHALVYQKDLAKAKWLFNERRTGDRAAACIELRLKMGNQPEQLKKCEIKHLTIELKATGIYNDETRDIEKRFLGTYGVARDVSYRRQLEAQLFKAQKMEAIGVLAGGIAHNFNNLLMGIQGYVSLMLEDVNDTHPHFKKLTAIEQHIRSGAELTRQLLSFAKGNQYEITAVNLNDLLQNSARMFGKTKKEITLQASLENDLWTIKGDESQLQQVFLNLYVNAWQAMPDGGTITIKSENVKVEPEKAEMIGIPPGNYIRIKVMDTGHGMDEMTMGRVFEPFFTTKGRNRGTGLGLSSAYGIIENHGGAIKVNSKKNQGSTFIIYLPAISGFAASKHEPPRLKVIPGNETILLIDDEELVLEVTQKMLESMGYKVIVARSGKEGLSLYRVHMEQIDLVILDMVMPHMGGRETLELIKDINPDTKVLLASGYSFNEKAELLTQCRCEGFIQKPFNIIEFSEILSRILNKKHPGNLQKMSISS